MRTYNIRGAAIAAFTVLALCGSAAAADCGHLKLLTSVQLVTRDHSHASFVPVKIEGVDKVLLFDTGGAATEITPEVADELHLSRTMSRVALYDVAAQASTDMVRASMQLGTLKASGMGMIVWNGSNPYPDQPGFAGILAPDVLQNYDVDVDFGTNKFSLLSPDHCPGQVVYWPASVVAVVPMKSFDSGHIIVSVMLDGHPVNALLDTGAWNTVLVEPLATSVYGLKLGSADTPVSGTLQDRPGNSTYHHTFKSLSLEGIAVNNAQVEIIPDMMQRHFRYSEASVTGSNIAAPIDPDRTPDMLIGMNVLRHFHIYIAYGERKVYITPAGTGASPDAFQDGAH
jgi:Aspartyl protease